jgi:hypothetical protein
MVRYHLDALIKSGDLVGEPADYTLARVAEAARAAAMNGPEAGAEDEADDGIVSYAYPTRVESLRRNRA